MCVAFFATVIVHVTEISSKTGPSLTSVFLMRELVAAAVADADALRSVCAERLRTLARIDPMHVRFYEHLLK
jgi:hypothetical protein